MPSRLVTVNPPLACLVDWFDPEHPPSYGEVRAVRTADDGSEEFMVRYSYKGDDGFPHNRLDWLPGDRVSVIQNQ